ncbi:uncharacterized protein [Asterias amurensis]|uniref:uncharacterized protein n=1 Tax=Asterias amurensis TaxID=7602 RepID=UPI003AB48790
MAGLHRCNSLPHFPSKFTSGHTAMHFVRLSLLTIFLCVSLPPSQFSAAQTTVGPTGLDPGFTEIVTVYVTEYEDEEITEDPQIPVEDSTNAPCNEPTSTPETEIPGSTMDIQFSITNMNMSDIQEQSDEQLLRDQLVVEIKRMYSDYNKLKAATVTNLRQGSIIVDVKLEFSEALNVQERDEVVTILYKNIVLNGTFGELLIEGLKVLNNEGEPKDINNACDITPCLRDDMKCYSVGTSCKSTCAGNKGYCLNDGECHENNNYIMCKCKGENFGDRCDKTPRPPSSNMRNENAYIGIIAAAGIAVILLLVLIVGCGFSRFSTMGKESDKSKLVPVDKNTVALEMLDEPPSAVGGVACQTMESFLLSKYMRNGVPPKPGFQHEEMQTIDSFLMAKAERERQPATPVNTPNGTGVQPPIAPVVAPSDEPQEPGVDAPDNGISNEAFLEDEGEIVPTADVENGEPDMEGRSGVAKKIIKV